MAKKLRIAITGATGLLGRNLLFEVIKQNINSLDDVEILILGRSKSNMTINERIRKILIQDGIFYISGLGKDRLEDFIKTGIKCLEIDLDDEKLDLSKVDLLKLKMEPIDIFYHIAALTDFRSSPQVVKSLENTNIGGTKRMLDLIVVLDVKEFCYVGTAYACGHKTGIIPADYYDLNNGFRNAYEKTKLEAELFVRDFSKRSKIRCRYFRPSTICGRLIEQPLGVINKFDVFYAWTAFFLYHKLKRTGSMDYESTFNVKIRLQYNLNSGLNIVPADYAAKVMYYACRRNDPEDSYYLVNNSEIPHDLYIKIMLETINIRGAEHVANVPADLNSVEKLYYKTVGQVFTPYITSGPMMFDNSNLKRVLDKTNIECPVVDEGTFKILMDYAKKYNFGLREKKHEVKN